MVKKDSSKKLLRHNYVRSMLSFTWTKVPRHRDLVMCEL